MLQKTLCILHCNFKDTIAREGSDPREIIRVQRDMFRKISHTGWQSTVSVYEKHKGFCIKK